jgi:ATP synthase protein I
MMPGVRSKAVRTVLGWQLLATAALAVLAGLLAGRHGALSAILGGLVSLTAGAFFGLSAARSQRAVARFPEAGAGFALMGVLTAWVVKLVLIGMLLLAVIAAYRSVVLWSFIGAFAVTTMLFTVVAFVAFTRHDG